MKLRLYTIKCDNMGGSPFTMNKTRKDNLVVCENTSNVIFMAGSGNPKGFVKFKVLVSGSASNGRVSVECGKEFSTCLKYWGNGYA